ncbi:MAG: MBL fold metallo-hydrolase [Bacteroidia bacterium]
MIQIKYLSHSCFLVICGKTKLLMDPWLKDPAYDKQWFLWPLPAMKPEELDADVILISHGHEDHLHTSTLKALDKKSSIFFPFQWREGIRPFMQHLGFGEVTEAVNFKTYYFQEIEITYISFSLESVIVIKYGEEVLVNINDALNSNHENAARFMLEKIKTRWPVITYLVSGWSGASYFPNQIRYPGKNDTETGQLREQYFANNFCTFTNYLQPAYALPIAPGFVLLKRENQWINRVKFSRNAVAGYYRTHYQNTSFTEMLVLYPGDTVKEGSVEINSALHAVSEEEQEQMAYRHYEKEINEVNRPALFPEAELDELLSQLAYWTNINKELYHATVLKDTDFMLHLEDVEGDALFHIYYQDKKFIIERKKESAASSKLLISTSGRRLLLAFQKMWGGDLLSIGYGLRVDVYEELSLEKNLDIVCVRLISRYPMTRRDMMRQPLRALKFYLSSPQSTTLWIRQKLLLKPYVNKYPFNERDHWITYSKCSLCAVCKMPEIDLGAYRTK